MSTDNQETMDTQNGSDDNEDDRKIFVGKLSWETSESELQQYMSKFGTVSSCNLKRDMESGRSRGFGFVVFAEADSIAKVLEQTEHKLQGNKIDPKRANPKGKNAEPPIKKIYVAKVSPTTTEQQIKEYFEQWGKVEKIEAPFDKEKDQRKNFVFVEFDAEETVNKVLAVTTDNPDFKHSLGGDEIEIKKATPNRRGGRGGWGRGGRGGRGGYGYGWGGGYGGYGGGYDGWGGNYGGYGGWGGYDQNYYGYGGWGGYDQSYYGYGAGGGQQQGSYGKAQKGGRGGGGYRPY